MATAKQRAWRAKFARLYGKKKGHASKKRHYKVKTMARRHRKSYSKGGFGFGRVMSQKNILYTVAGMYLAPRMLGVDAKLGAAAGGYFGAGIPGAIAGYVAAPVVGNVIGGAIGSGSTSNW